MLESIRFDISTAYGVKQASFKDSVEPVFHFLVRLLLDQSVRAASAGSDTERRTLIAEARARVESLEAAELRDYFQDDCVDAILAATRDAGEIDPKAAVIYPVLLDERTDILVNFPKGALQHFSIPVGRREITAAIFRFRRCLGDASCFEFFEDAQRLYDWFVRPLEPQLQAAEVGTLAFVPDGPLRTVPMAALTTANST